MRIIADLHLHSKYSRATSPNCDLGGLSEWAKIKGVGLLGTGDFTHPKWIRELKKGLKPAGEGIYEHEGTSFMLSAEVSNIFELAGKVKKIHTLLLAPSFEVVSQFNDAISTYGNLAEDGRPMLKMDIAELLDIAESTSKEIMFVPAHCLPPEEKVLSEGGSSPISELRKGDKVLTHKGRYKSVLKILKRKFRGNLYGVVPYYLTEGTRTTPEHPFYAIKSSKNPCASRKVCKPTCADKGNCARRFYEVYSPAWVQAKNLEEGDILVFPRLKTVRDVQKIRLKDYVRKIPKTSRLRELPAQVSVDGGFCRLIGYYLAEGCVNGRDAVSFSFNSSEREYMEDVKGLIKSLFGLEGAREDVRGNGTELIFYSKYLMQFFSNICYGSSDKGAGTKCLPPWMLLLPFEKQAQVLIGWWRGDTGYTISAPLFNQMKVLLIRLGIAPAITLESREKHNSRTHLLEKRKVLANHDLYGIRRLSFLEDNCNLAANPLFKKFNSKLPRRHGWMDADNFYAPIRKIELSEYEGDVFNLEVEGDNSYVSSSAAVHNCWTPWFGVFGSKSGFDSLGEAFGKKKSRIKAIETGLSSDPQMNWMLSSLDGVSLISNSDAHSPQKIAREANVFELNELTYKGVKNAIETRDGFVKTYEFYPEEGKYHWDGHRNCGVCLNPPETRRLGGRCPKCRRPLTVGVLNRVYALADREQGYLPKGSVPFTRLIPLATILSAVRGKGEQTKTVTEEYFRMVHYFGSEFAALEAPREQLRLASDKEAADAIVHAREGKVYWVPGHDGVFGELSLKKVEQPARSVKGQKSLMDF